MNINSTFLPLITPHFFWLNLFFIAGIMCATEHYIIAGGLLLTSMAMYCLTLSKALIIQNISITFLFFGLGWWITTRNTRPLFSTNKLENVIITAKVIDKIYRDSPAWRHRLTLEVREVCSENNKIPCQFLLHLYASKKIFAWIDDIIECGPININLNEASDFKQYLQKEGIHGTCFVEKPLYKKLYRPSFSFVDWLYWQRELLQIKLRKKMSPETYSFFSSLFMGNKHSIKSTLERFKGDFKLWGISHHLARSGLHLIIFILIWHFLLNLLPLPFIIKHTVSALLVFIYALFSWPSISFWRAFSTYFFYKISLTYDMALHPLHAISAVSLFFLCINPLQLFFLDFQLSFLLTFCLAWIAQLNHQHKIFSTKSIAA